MDGYKVTNNENNKISSSYLSTQFKSKTNSKMTTSIFKDDMLVISGIALKKMKAGNYFIALKAKPEITNLDEYKKGGRENIYKAKLCYNIN